MDIPELDRLPVHLGLIIVVLVLTLVFRRRAGILARAIVLVIRRVTKSKPREGSNFDEQIAIAITPPLRFFSLFIGISLILLMLELPAALVQITARITTSLVGFTFFWTMLRLVDIVARYIEAKRRFKSLDATIVTFSSQLAKVVILVLMLVSVLGTFGIDIGAAVAGLGIGGLAIALASQDALANFIAYFFIVSDAPFKVGDFIEVSGVSGSVEAITFRSTRLRMGDRAQIAIPNQAVCNGTITNWSRVDRRLIKTVLNVTYDTSEEQMRALIAHLHEMLDGHERVIKSEPRVIEFDEYGLNSLNIFMSFSINTTSANEMRAIKSDIYFHIMSIAQGLEISFARPTTTINFDSSATSLFTPNENLVEAK